MIGTLPPPGEGWSLSVCRVLFVPGCLSAVRQLTVLRVPVQAPLDPYLGSVIQGSEGGLPERVMGFLVGNC
ncbi:hypothetical protein H671_8g19314 [Cricetulus griseus]|nr:hypothetical protein H671_8g19314 [Cricetulus griseus]